MTEIGFRASRFHGDVDVGRWYSQMLQCLSLCGEVSEKRRVHFGHEGRDTPLSCLA